MGMSYDEDPTRLLQSCPCRSSQIGVTGVCCKDPTTLTKYVDTGLIPRNTHMHVLHVSSTYLTEYASWKKELFCIVAGIGNSHQTVIRHSTDAMTRLISRMRAHYHDYIHMYVSVSISSSSS